MPGLFDRIKDTWTAGAPTTLAALSTFVVSGTAPGGYQTFNQRYVFTPTPDANIPVAIVSQLTTDWMTCWCTYTAANTLRVDTIIFSSNGDSGVTFPAGTMDVFVTPSARAVAGLREVNTFTANNYFNGGNVGIGTSSPASPLHVVSAANFQPQIIADHVAGAGTGAAYFLLDRARGTPSARTAVVSGDQLGTLMARGYDGSASQNAAWLAFDVDGAVSAGNVPTGITFFTTPVGGASDARMHIDAGGNVGIGTTGPDQRLVVSGAIQSGTTGNNGSIYIGGANVSLRSAYSANVLGVYTSNTEQIRIGSNGFVGFNTSLLSKRVNVEIGNSYDGIRILSTASGSGAGAVFEGIGYRVDANQSFETRFAGAYRRSDGTAIASGARLGGLLFGGQWGTDTTLDEAKVLYPASIMGVAEGSFTASNAMATGISFRTGSSGESAYAANTVYGTERMRIDSSGNVGIGTTASATIRLDVAGRSRIGNLVTQAAPSTSDILSTAHVALSGSGGNYLTIGQYPAGIAGQQFGTWMQASFQAPATAVYNLFLQPLGGNVGVGATTDPGARLSVTSTGAKVFGSAHSGLFATNAGSLGATSGNELALATIGFTSPNGSGLGIRAYRHTNGGDWTTSSIVLGMDVDDTVRAGAFISLKHDGFVGIRTVNPQAQLHVERDVNGEGGIFVNNPNAGGNSYAALRIGPSNRGTNGDALVYAGANTTGLRAGNRVLIFEVGSGDPECMRIDLNRNLLLGTTFSKNRLTVTAGAYANSPTLGSAGGIAYFTNPDVSYGLNIGNSSADGRVWLQAQRTDGSTAPYNITLNEAGGNVGIGTASPGTKLEVAGASNTALARIRSTDGTRCDLRFESTGSNSGLFFGNGTTFDIGRLFYDNSGNNMIFATNTAERMRIDTNGNVGIGTGSPSSYDAKLAVFNGNIALTTTLNKLYLYYISATNHAHISTDVGGQVTISNGTAGVTEKLRISTSGGVSISTTTDVGPGVLRIGRQNTAAEGGQIEFCRASDNEVGWYIDSIGASTGSDPGGLRWVDSRTPAVRLSLSGRGQLLIEGDLGPLDVDTQAVGFRGSPNNDKSANYTLALTDAGRTIRKTVTTAFTVTIPADATVNFPLGTCIMLCNVVDGTTAYNTSNNLTVACAASGPTLVWLNGTTKNNRTSTTNTLIRIGGSATLRKVAANLWTITGAGIA